MKATKKRPSDDCQVKKCCLLKIEYTVKFFCCFLHDDISNKTHKKIIKLLTTHNQNRRLFIVPKLVSIVLDQFTEKYSVIILR